MKLDLPAKRTIIVCLAGGGGSGTPVAPLTMAARALPDALWITIGPVHTEGHETAFHNLEHRGWVDAPLDYLAAADVVVASAGDNTVHEIARAARPYLCIPEWRYFNEQHRKVEALAALGAARTRETWPGALDDWRKEIAATQACDLGVLHSLFAADAARRIGEHLVALDARLWGEQPDVPEDVDGAERIVTDGLAEPSSDAARAA